MLLANFIRNILPFIMINNLASVAMEINCETGTPEPSLCRNQEAIALDNGRLITSTQTYHLFGLPHYGQLSPEALKAIDILQYAEYFSFACRFITPQNKSICYQYLNTAFMSSLLKQPVGQVIKAKGTRYDPSYNSYESYGDFEKYEFCEASFGEKIGKSACIDKFVGQFLIGYVVAGWRIDSINTIDWNPAIRGLLYSLDLTPSGKEFVASLPDPLPAHAEDFFESSERNYKRLYAKLREGNLFQLTLKSV
ncbi:hypothetical protein [Candidatus Odyssella thessalonicensis]|uniref:hypothetical protein n=1 Tax=Candidatus Odyssella thessalonicensis TaxID=84647 RepID=UPI000225B4C0|nr:hypothetical protein [Candidatus Odyssella thessalonicensis]